MRAAALLLVLAGLLLPGARARAGHRRPARAAAERGTHADAHADRRSRTPTTTRTSGAGRCSIIGGGLLLTFLVIGRVIFRDARRHVPADAHPGALREQGPHKHGKQAKAQARKKTKAQRAARRRNR